MTGIKPDESVSEHEEDAELVWQGATMQWATSQKILHLKQPTQIHQPWTIFLMISLTIQTTPKREKGESCGPLVSIK